MRNSIGGMLIIGTPMAITKLLCNCFLPENPDGITNEYLPHALEWEIIHYPVASSVGN